MALSLVIRMRGLANPWPRVKPTSRAALYWIPTSPQLVVSLCAEVVQARRPQRSPQDDDEASGKPSEVQASPGKPREGQGRPRKPREAGPGEAQGSPGNAREGQGGPGRPREAQGGPGRPQEGQGKAQANLRIRQNPTIPTTQGVRFGVIVIRQVCTGVYASWHTLVKWLVQALRLSG